MDENYNYNSIDADPLDLDLGMLDLEDTDLGGDIPDLEAILAEFRTEAPEPGPVFPDDLAETESAGRDIVSETWGQDFRAAQFRDEDLQDSRSWDRAGMAAEDSGPTAFSDVPEEDPFTAFGVSFVETAPEEAFSFSEETPATPGHTEVYTPAAASGDDDVAEADLDELPPAPEPRRTEPKRRKSGLSRRKRGRPALEEELPEAVTESYSDLQEEGVVYAEAELPPEPALEQEREEDPAGPGLGERLLTPLVTLMAALTMRREERIRKAKEPPEPEPELPPDKAARLYAGKLSTLKLRTLVALIPSVILVILSALHSGGVTLAGGMGNLSVAALMCMVLLLQVMLTGLDVFTDGLVALWRRKPDLESLVALSCICACVDALYITLAGSDTAGLPYCAAAALSMACALWSRRLRYRGLRASFQTISKCKRPYAVAVSHVDDQGGALLKSPREPEGFVRAAQEASLPDRLYRVLSPFLLAAAVILSLLTAIVQKASFLHSLSAMVAASAGFSMLFCYALPFSLLAGRLLAQGAAVAGFTGAAEMYKSRRIVTADTDLFPPGTVSVSGIRVLEGAFTSKVVANTGSLIACAGSGLAPVFTELMRQQDCVMQRVDDFACHDGGGLRGTIRGEQVLVGTAGFMHLMGVRLPQNLQLKNAVFTASNGALQAIFVLEYQPASSVRRALEALLQSRVTPLFAIRDFNITPLFIRKQFRVPTDSFRFPPFVERYRISDLELPREKAPAAILTREGLGPMVEAAEGGRKLYLITLLGTILSIAGSLVGLVLMFFLHWNGAYDSASSWNLVLFLLLWLVPILVLNWSLRR